MRILSVGIALCFVIGLAGCGLIGGGGDEAPKTTEEPAAEEPAAEEPAAEEPKAEEAEAEAKDEKAEEGDEGKAKDVAKKSSSSISWGSGSGGGI